MKQTFRVFLTDYFRRKMGGMYRLYGASANVDTAGDENVQVTFYVTYLVDTGSKSPAKEYKTTANFFVSPAEMPNIGEVTSDEGANLLWSARMISFNQIQSPAALEIFQALFPHVSFETKEDGRLVTPVSGGYHLQYFEEDEKWVASKYSAA